jgi:hypothetical protein
MPSIRTELIITWKMEHRWALLPTQYTHTHIVRNFYKINVSYIWSFYLLHNCYKLQFQKRSSVNCYNKMTHHTADSVTALLSRIAFPTLNEVWLYIATGEFSLRYRGRSSVKWLTLSSLKPYTVYRYIHHTYCDGMLVSRKSGFNSETSFPRQRTEVFPLWLGKQLFS